jgi:hypothetical protein
MTKIHLKIIHKIKDGQKLVYIPIRGEKDKYCRMLEEDFGALLDFGLHPLFRFKQGTVFARSNYKNIGVARLLANCQAGQNVRYINADPLDLRQQNLLILPGMSLYAARSLLKKSLSPLRYELSHVYEEN